jgi:hypothetical protein
VACGSWAFALSTSAVDRLIAVPDASCRPGDRPGPPGHLGSLPEPPGYSAWDLGALLGLGPQPESWILCRVPSAFGELRVALRAGACLSVGALPPALLSPLPRAMSFARSGLARAAFAMSARSRGRHALASLGLVLDLRYLFTAEEALVALGDLESEGPSS